MDLERTIERSDELHAEVGRLVDSMGSADLETDVVRLGLEIARFQAARVGPIAQLYASLGVDPASLAGLDEVAPLSAELFRLRRIAVHPPELDVRTFRTSGTTRGAARRGTHPFRVTSTMERAALAWASRMLWPDLRPPRLVLLTAPERLAPDSSLSFMLARFAERLAPEQTSWHFDGERLDAGGVVAACARARERAEPTLVAGTAFAFAELLERTSEGALGLPAGSRVMPTGGFKGRQREIEPDELRAALAHRFGVPEAYVVGEYGMTELSSQLYEGTLVRALGLGCAGAEHGRFYAPPWVRVRALDPIHHAPLPVGEVGLCCLLDLANVDSSLAILTADLVRRHSDGAVELVGRASAAPARGCSLTIEEALDRDGEADRKGSARGGTVLS